MVFGPPGISIGSAVFVGHTCVTNTDRQTDRQTTLRATSAAIGRIYALVRFSVQPVYSIGLSGQVGQISQKRTFGINGICFVNAGCPSCRPMNIVKSTKSPTKTKTYLTFFLSWVVVIDLVLVNIESEQQMGIPCVIFCFCHKNKHCYYTCLEKKIVFLLLSTYAHLTSFIYNVRINAEIEEFTYRSLWQELIRRWDSKRQLFTTIWHVRTSKY